MNSASVALLNYSAPAELLTLPFDMVHLIPDAACVYTYLLHFE